jgi:hypothetical protein
MALAPDPTHLRINALDVVVTLCLKYTLYNVFIRLWKRERLYGLEGVIAYFATVRSLQGMQGQLIVPNPTCDIWPCLSSASPVAQGESVFLQALALGQFASQYVVPSNDLGRLSMYLVIDSNLDVSNKVCRTKLLLFRNVSAI